MLLRKNGCNSSLSLLKYSCLDIRGSSLPKEMTLLMHPPPTPADQEYVIAYRTDLRILLKKLASSEQGDSYWNLNIRDPFFSVNCTADRAACL